MKTRGRPKVGQTTDHRIQATVDPAIRRKAEAIAKDDARLRSLSQYIEAAMAFYAREYKAAKGQLDLQNFPLRNGTKTPR